MTDEEAQKDYPMYDIQQVCDYFTNEDGLQSMAELSYPGYGDIRFINSQLFYFPIYIVLGDMYLWSGHYWEAAVCYHKYITTRNGANSSYPLYAHRIYWYSDDYDPKTDLYDNYLGAMFLSESFTARGELITMIPMDSLKSEANYSQLRNIFSARPDNDYEVSAAPSQNLIQLSASQDYWNYDGRTMSFSKAPKGLSYYCDGDLRLVSYCSINENKTVNGNLIEKLIFNYKYSDSRNIHIYRRSMVYLRLAEAVNRAGYPLYAFKILETGVDEDVLKNIICKDYPADSAKLVTNLNFPTDKYLVADPTSLQGDAMNTVGIHWRGCGYPMGDTLYVMPYNKEIVAGPDSAAQQIAWQIEKVEDMIVDEMALELAFEGTRFYDLMRVALHRNDPAYLDRKVKARNGEGNDSGISVDLTNMHNWFLHWQGKIGY